MDNNDAINNKIIKRKKKTSLEDTIPAYMQEAFFGANIIAKSKETNANFTLDEEFDERNMQMKSSLIDSRNTKSINNHRISLDENMLKSTQQNKKGHTLELGIEDFLDGDIVSYLFNENRNLIEFNSDQDFNNRANRNGTKDNNYDEKILIDEKLYEDLFHQIPIITTTTTANTNTTSNNNNNNNNNIKNTNVNEFINDSLVKNSSTSNSLEPSSVIKLKTDTFNNLLNSNDKQEHQSLKDVLATTTSLIQDEHHNIHHHHHHHQLMSSKDMKHQNIDNINIDDLARQLKESTHKYPIENNNNDKSLNHQHHHLHHQNQIMKSNFTDQL